MMMFLMIQKRGYAGDREYYDIVKKHEDAGQTFKEFVYRKGQVSSWREELSPKVNQLFCNKYPDLQ